jgi:hypothetical protein
MTQSRLMPDAAARMPQYAELPGSLVLATRFYPLLSPSLTHGGRLSKVLAMRLHEADHSADATISPNSLRSYAHCRDLKEPTDADAL